MLSHNPIAYRNNPLMDPKEYAQLTTNSNIIRIIFCGNHNRRTLYLSNKLDLYTSVLKCCKVYSVNTNWKVLKSILTSTHNQDDEKHLSTYK